MAYQVGAEVSYNELARQLGISKNTVERYLDLLSKEYYFWRTYDQQEIDLVEVSAGQVSAYDFKWGKASKSVPVFFAKNYPQASFSVINRENYLPLIV